MIYVVGGIFIVVAIISLAGIAVWTTRHRRGK